jgi:hypothetical protein
MSVVESGCPMSRRRLLGTLGAGAAGALLAPAGAKAAGSPPPPAPQINTAVRSDRFGRLFDLKPVDHALHLAAGLPRCRAWFDPGEGHFFFRRRVREILAQLAGPVSAEDWTAQRAGLNRLTA